MRKRTLSLLAAFATAIAVLPAGANAQEQELELAPEANKEVIESESGSYIVVMEEDPVVAVVGQDDLDTAVADELAADLEEEQDEVLEDIGADGDDKVNTYTNALNGFSAFLSYDEAQELAANPKVALVLPDELHQLTAHPTPQYLGLTGRGEAWQAGLTGEDVVIGVIDSGIWPEHPSFADDGSYGPHAVLPLDDSRPACEFGNAAHVTDPSIGADAEFTCNNKLLGARQMLDTYRFAIGASPLEYDSARDDDGHGTHTASTAGGNAAVSATMYGQDLGEVSGIAPRARIIAYKGLGSLGGFGSDLAAAIDQAVADGVDVINYSVGGGSSLPVGPDDIAFLFAADAGVYVATSAGNSGPGDDTVGSPGNAPWLTTVAANTHPLFYENRVKVFGPPGGGQQPDYRYGYRQFVGAGITPGVDRSPFVDAEDAGGDLCLPGTLDPEVVEGTIVLCRRGAIGRAAKGESVAAAGGIGMILYNNDDDDNLFTDTHVVPAVHVNNSYGLALKQYIDDRQAAGEAPEATIWQGGERFTKAPSVTYFSSRGPNGPVPDIIKPDITAPGHQILAGASPGVSAFGDSFQAISGTSMSSPHVAGLFALIKQAHPDWSPAAAKSAIMTTADLRVRSEDRRTQADYFEMGAGQIDPGRVEQRNSVFRPGLVFDAGLFEYAAFTCGADLGIFAPGSCDFLAGLGIPSDASDLNMASIGVAELAGSQTVIRTVTSVADTAVTYRVRPTPPDGYDIAVTPHRFTVEPGESVTLEITITNTGAPAGEWRFGQLALVGGGYKVISPVAVNGALFDAPAEIAAAGADGSVDLDVLFGYDGTYTAGAHGLVASTPLEGAIGQDPDQTYPSGDDAIGPAGGVDRWDISLTDTALLRISLEIPGADDVDLFLENSAGALVAASTNGGTAELIDVVLPPDDTYTLVVHGWSVPNAPLAYSVDTWAVPLAAGTGSLTIDAAPDTAVTGASGTVTAGWSGLAPGNYLGAVSHAGDEGLLGLTIISVQN